MGGEVNDSLEVVFINDKTPINHYSIDVRPIKHKIPIRGVRDKDIKKSLILKNGVEALFINNPSSDVLVFESNNLQYKLSVDKRVSNKITSDILVKVANRIE
ncbi:hypothetical protein [Cytobacillus purgationiresistens]|uniref:DUF4367 domain-containing protein n=1 Tax=Cytobacillus purgationiresistens TaxID=863449 RepID=A0ABU0AS27_9BACI|nr:hypothetical protein [Cytobacillus purgationiresistens]MDQ0273679.1 hypothetical protein [Cytobacillus purgationiresistens]